MCVGEVYCKLVCFIIYTLINIVFGIKSIRGTPNYAVGLDTPKLSFYMKLFREQFNSSEIFKTVF